jgi:hypothetical protein
MVAVNGRARDWGFATASGASPFMSGVVSMATETMEEAIEPKAPGAPKPRPKVRYQLIFTADDADKVTELKPLMETARSVNDVFRLSVLLAQFVLSKQREGYKLAMVKDDEVEAVRLFI